MTAKIRLLNWLETSALNPDNWSWLAIIIAFLIDALVLALVVVP